MTKRTRSASPSKAAIRREMEASLAVLVGLPVVNLQGKHQGYVINYTFLPAGPALDVLLTDQTKAKFLPYQPEFVELKDITLYATELGMAVLAV